MKLLNAKRKSEKYERLEKSLNMLVEDGYIKGWKDLKIDGNGISYTIVPVEPVKFWVCDIKL